MTVYYKCNNITKVPLTANVTSSYGLAKSDHIKRFVIRIVIIITRNVLQSVSRI